ncbi:MAG: hypothetical protein R3220_02665 [Balneolaceae bacterium]|nr:hypothetical protein [Balneolaceae bacterium]
MDQNHCFCALLVLFVLPFLIVDCTQTSSIKKQTAENLKGTPSESNRNFKIVGYYSLTEALKADVGTVPFDQLTHINFWFLNPDSLGNYNHDLSGLSDFVDEAHHQNVKVLFRLAEAAIIPITGIFLQTNTVHD